MPFRQKEDGNVEVYLQKRDCDAPTRPGKYSFFGGGVEKDESPEEAMLRETREELDYTPKEFFKLGYYELPPFFWHIFCERVGDQFEKQITVLEGESGAFFSENEALAEPLLEEVHRIILRDLFSSLKNS